MFQDVAHYSKLVVLCRDALDVSHVSHCMPAGEALRAEGRRSFRGECLHTFMVTYGPSVFVDNSSGC